MNREDLLASVAEDMAYLRRKMWSMGSCGAPGTVMPTRAQIGLLFMIAQEESPSPKTLAEKLGTTPSAVTQLIDGLLREKLLIRSEDVEDRRRVLLSLSEEGKARLREIKKAHLASLIELSKPLSESELSQLHTLMQKLISSFNSSV